MLRKTKEMIIILYRAWNRQPRHDYSLPYSLADYLHQIKLCRERVPLLSLEQHAEAVRMPVGFMQALADVLDEGITDEEMEELAKVRAQQNTPIRMDATSEIGRINRAVRRRPRRVALSSSQATNSGSVEVTAGGVVIVYITWLVPVDSLSTAAPLLVPALASPQCTAGSRTRPASRPAAGTPVRGVGRPGR